MNLATVLCLEHPHSRFAVSQRIFLSGSYRIMTATSGRSAVIAAKAVPAIVAAVLACPEITTEAQIHIASEIQSRRPTLPAILVSAAPVTAPIPEDLLIFPVHDIELLVERLHAVIRCIREGQEKRATLLEMARELRAESKRLRAQTQQLVEQALETAKKYQGRD